MLIKDIRFLQKRIDLTNTPIKIEKEAAALEPKAPKQKTKFKKAK